MQIPIEGWITSQLWRLPGGTAEIRVYADTDFVTSDNKFIPQGRVSDPKSFYFTVPCTIAGNVLTIPDTELPSTVDALVNPHARYTAIIVAAGKKIPFIANFALNTLEAGDPSLTWAEILLFRDMPAAQQSAPSLLRQIAGMISLAVGSLNKASILNPGVAAGSWPANDPTFPIHVAQTDPAWENILNGIGLVTKSGRATMVDGSALAIPAPTVNPDSIVLAFSMSDTVNGNLKAPAANIVDGVSFDVFSTDGGDNGEISWIVTEAL